MTKPPLALSTTAALLLLCCGDGSPGDDAADSPPGDDAADSIDDSPALVGDSPIRALCGEHCAHDCERLVECGRYSAGEGYTVCLVECTGLDGRYCVNWTFDRFCPAEVYGPDRVITQLEYDRCLADARTAACWCADGQDRWDPVMPMPLSCTAPGLCDPR